MKYWVTSSRAPVSGGRRWESALAHGADERFHVVQIALQRAAAGVGQAVLGARHAPVERLEALDVVSVLEPARVDAQVAVGGLHQTLELIEAEPVIDRQRADDAEAHALVDHAVEQHRRPGPPRPDVMEGTAVRFRARAAAPSLATVPPRDENA